MAVRFHAEAVRAYFLSNVCNDQGHWHPNNTSEIDNLVSAVSGHVFKAKDKETRETNYFLSFEGDEPRVEHFDHFSSVQPDNEEFPTLELSPEFRAALKQCLEEAPADKPLDLEEVFADERLQGFDQALLSCVKAGFEKIFQKQQALEEEEVVESPQAMAVEEEIEFANSYAQRVLTAEDFEVLQAAIATHTKEDGSVDFEATFNSIVLGAENHIVAAVKAKYMIQVDAAPLPRDEIRPGSVDEGWLEEGLEITRESYLEDLLESEQAAKDFIDIVDSFLNREEGPSIDWQALRVVVKASSLLEDIGEDILDEAVEYEERRHFVSQVSSRITTPGVEHHGRSPETTLFEEIAELEASSEGGLDPNRKINIILGGPEGFALKRETYNKYLQDDGTCDIESFYLDPDLRDFINRRLGYRDDYMHLTEEVMLAMKHNLEKAAEALEALPAVYMARNILTKEQSTLFKEVVERHTKSGLVDIEALRQDESLEGIPEAKLDRLINKLQADQEMDALREKDMKRLREPELKASLEGAVEQMSEENPDRPVGLCRPIYVVTALAVAALAAGIANMTLNAE